VNTASIIMAHRHQYSFNEYADMHLAYGAAGENAHEARRIYTARFPGRVIPSVNTFASVDRRVRETGSFVVNRPDAGRQRRVRTVEFEENVLEMINEDPQTSSRTIGNALQVGEK